MHIKILYESSVSNMLSLHRVDAILTLLGNTGFFEDVGPVTGEMESASWWLQLKVHHCDHIKILKILFSLFVVLLTNFPFHCDKPNSDLTVTQFQWPLTTDDGNCQQKSTKARPTSWNLTASGQIAQGDGRLTAVCEDEDVPLSQGCQSHFSSQAT